MLFGRDKVMRPKKFVGVLDAWSAKGGEFPDLIPHRHKITTGAEVEAVCRALCSAHIYAPNSIGTPALFDLAAFFQDAETTEAENVFRCQGLPLLRRILSDALADLTENDATDEPVAQRVHGQIFILKILASYEQRGDASLFIKAARDPRMCAGDLWTVIFEIVEERHPEADEIYEALRHPLPDRRAGVGYLFWANTVSRRQPMSRHPFDTDRGIAQLLAYLADDPDDCVPALCAAMGISFVNASAHEKLIGRADQHSDPAVRMEAAISLARTGSDFGWQRLAHLCLNPRSAYRAVEALTELGLESHIPSKARTPDFQAMAEMCEWLSNPMEFNRPPDEITLYDTRVLNWPPTDDGRRLWLFKYRFEPRGDEVGVKEGIGMVGSTTFSLFGEVTAALAPEDAYGLHCCWELELQEDPRTPAERSVAAGRRILAKANRDFPAK
jgi:hypothetical protein